MVGNTTSTLLNHEGYMNDLDAREANTEYFDLNEPTYSIAAKKWFVSIMYDSKFYLHKDGTIQFGAFVDLVPGEHIFTGLYDSRKLAVKVIKTYNRRWALAHQNIDLDTELVKELRSSLL